MEQNINIAETTVSTVCTRWTLQDYINLSKTEQLERDIQDGNWYHISSALSSETNGQIWLRADEKTDGMLELYNTAPESYQNSALVDLINKFLSGNPQDTSFFTEQEQAICQTIRNGVNASRKGRS